MKRKLAGNQISQDKASGSSLRGKSRDTVIHTIKRSQLSGTNEDINGSFDNFFMQEHDPITIIREDHDRSPNNIAGGYSKLNR